MAMAVVMSVFGAGCHDAARPSAGSTPGPAQPPVAVRVETVAKKSVLATEEVVGTVRSRLRATIEAKVSGRIGKMLVTQGQPVKAGDPIAELDAREIQARLDQALAQREQAERELKRLEDLFKQQVVTQQEIDAVQARARVARAAVVEAETMSGYVKIAAPFDGVVTRKLADVGDLALPGKPLVEMEDASALRLEADVPEALINRIQKGAQLSVRLPTLELELTGTVSEIAPAGDPVSRTFLIKLDLPARPGLRAGLFGRVAVPVSEGTSLRVPAAAVAQRGQMEMVFVVTDGRAVMRLVKTGRRFGPEVELLAGVTAGESIVAEVPSQLRDGQPVEVRR